MFVKETPVSSLTVVHAAAMSSLERSDGVDHGREPYLQGYSRQTRRRRRTGRPRIAGSTSSASTISDSTSKQVDDALPVGGRYQRIPAAFSGLRDENDIRVAGVGVGDVEGLGYCQLGQYKGRRGRPAWCRGCKSYHQPAARCQAHSVGLDRFARPSCQTGLEVGSGVINEVNRAKDIRH